MPIYQGTRNKTANANREPRMGQSQRVCEADKRQIFAKLCLLYKENTIVTWRL